jgi:hypothetical protein
MGFKTGDEYLHFAILLALGDARKCVRGLWYGLQEDERKLIATRVIEHLKKHSDPWKLDREMPPPIGIGHSAQPGDLDDE